MRILLSVLLLAGTAWGQQLPVCPGANNKTANCVLVGPEVPWDQYSPDPHHPGYYCAFKRGKLLACELPTLVPITPHPDPDIIVYDLPAAPFLPPVNTCRAPEPSANYGCKFWDAGPIGLTRYEYFEAQEAIVNVLDHVQLNNAEWENLDALAHAVNNVYLFLGTSKATETDAVKAKLELDALHIGEKLAKHHIPTHEEDMDELLRKMDGWGKKL